MGDVGWMMEYWKVGDGVGEFSFENAELRVQNGVLMFRN